MDEGHWIHDWNRVDGFVFRTTPGFHLNDETLRDGLQSPSVRDPTVEEKLHILHLMDALKLNSADLGLPGAGERAARDIERLVEEIAREKLGISPNVAVRTVIADLEPVAGIMQRTGVAVEACAFLGSSPILQPQVLADQRRGRLSHRPAGQKAERFDANHHNVGRECAQLIVSPQVAHQRR